MELKWKLHQYTFKPADYTVDETGHPGARKVMDVHRGTLVAFVAMRVGLAFNGTQTISIGDGDEAEGFLTIAEAATILGAGGLVNGAGIHLVTPDTGSGVSANGKLYTEDDTIDLAYDYTSDTTQGLATVYIVYAEIE